MGVAFRYFLLSFAIAQQPGAPPILEPLGEFKQREGIARVVCKGDKIFVGDYSGDVNIYDSNTRAKTTHLRNGHRESIGAMAAPTAKLLVTTSLDNSIAIWDIEEREIIRKFAHPGPVGALASSRQGAVMASGDVSGEVQLREPRSGKLVMKFNMGRNVSALAFVNDRLLAIASFDENRERSGVLTLFDIHKQQATREVSLEGLPICVSVSPAADRVAVGLRNGQIRMIAMPDMKLAGTIAAHTSRVDGVEFLSKRLLVSVSHDKTIVVSDIENKKVVHSVARQHEVVALSVASERETIVTADLEGNIALFKYSGTKASNKD